MIELLAPAGNLEKLKWAVAYGADAVYFGLQQFSLRSYAGNFSLEEAQQGLDYLHARGRKGYATLNIYPFSDEYAQLLQAARALEEMGVDALIVSDLGVLWQLKSLHIRVPLHISTQANTVSYQTVQAYGDLGVKRVNLARELSLEQIRAIQAALQGSEMETEVFIHGAVCFSYSGRCAISDYLAGRSANRGACAHPCRWQYQLVEEKRPGEFLPVFEDDRGLYLFNSKELALFPFIPQLIGAGVKAFKIEGRMKALHYLASVVAFYRSVLDGVVYSESEGLELLNRVSNRGYSHGFMKGHITADDYGVHSSAPGATALMVGVITEPTAEQSSSIMEVRNKVHAGERIEILSPGGRLVTSYLPQVLMHRNGSLSITAVHGDFIYLEESLPPFSIVRSLLENSCDFS